jgi:hypothetical protein
MQTIHQVIESQDFRGFESSIVSQTPHLSVLPSCSILTDPTHFGVRSPVSKSSAARFPKKSRLSTSQKIQEFFAPFESPGPEEYPSPEDYEMDSRYTRHAKGRARQNSTASLASVVTGRLSWFKNKAFAKPTDSGYDEPRSKSRDLNEDPILSLDVTASLFPQGEPDYLNPGAFHDLPANAESLVSKMQAAYRLKCEENETLRMQMLVQADELDESETRAQHLKTQLDEMSLRMARNERDFSNKIRDEREKREEIETRCRKILDDPSPHLWSSTRSENSDSGFESEGESEPKTPMSGHFPSLSIDETLLDRKLESSYALRQPGHKTTVSFQADSLFGFDCDLRAENQELKQRVAELETVVDSCLLLL